MFVWWCATWPTAEHQVQYLLILEPIPAGDAYATYIHYFHRNTTHAGYRAQTTTQFYGATMSSENANLTLWSGYLALAAHDEQNS